MKAYLGVDIGSISTKGVVVDDKAQILAHEYLWTEGNPIHAVKRVIDALQKQIDGKDIQVKAVGTTGSARKLIGVVLGAQTVKNEITAHAIGTMSRVPDVRTIFEIGGQDSKIIILEDGIVTDYAMNTLCAAGTGSFLMSQAKRLGLAIEELGEMALKSQNPTRIAARCTVFAESDLVHKAQIGHKKEDIVAGICNAVVSNYLNNVGKGKRIAAPIVFQGGVSKNVGVVRAFEQVTGSDVYVDEFGHLMGALGVAVLAKQSGKEQNFDFNIQHVEFITKGTECKKCANNCEIIHVYRGEDVLDSWGNRCERGVSA
ncbi:MAG: acyl-CoA dehydratase activase [Clostridiales bacterium]|jgi:predicted CoA-substrate-specific enzyme activase|nr:acyl-CoA dehydratase activase [Clostridiales bacterium]